MKTGGKRLPGGGQDQAGREIRAMPALVIFDLEAVALDGLIALLVGFHGVGLSVLEEEASVLRGKVGLELTDVAPAAVEDVEERSVPAREIHEHDQPAVLHDGEAPVSGLMIGIFDEFEDVPDLILG